MAEAKADQVVITQFARLVSKEELPSVIQDQVKGAPKEARLSFVIRPLDKGEEFSRVIDRMARAQESNKCHGNCD